jgi:hypothetical protein
MEHFNWRQYVPANDSIYIPSNDSTQLDWHQYEKLENTSGGQGFSGQQLEPGNFSGSASDATTEAQLNIWRERAQIRINRFVPTSYQNSSFDAVDSEYQQNLHRINSPAPAATEAPEVAVAPEVAATEAPAVDAATAAPAVVPEEPEIATTTHTTTWWLISLAEVPAVSPLKQASLTLLMFASLAGAAAFAVGRQRRQVGASSEPLLPTEYTIVP